MMEQTYRDYAATSRTVPMWYLLPQEDTVLNGTNPATCHRAPDPEAEAARTVKGGERRPLKDADRQAA